MTRVSATRRYPPVVCCAVLLALLLLPLGNVSAAPPSGQKWVATWGQAMTSNYTRVKGAGGKVKKDIYGHPVEHAPAVHDVTLRQTVHTSIGGDRVRIRLSNYFGRTPLTVSAAHVALQAGKGRASSAIDPSSDRTLTFHGKSSVTIAPGQQVTSDPVALHVPKLSDVVVSLYFAGTAHLGDVHVMEHARTTAAVSGNAVAAATLQGRSALGPLDKHAERYIYELDEVDVTAPVHTLGIVAFGDSITDGAFATAPGRTWPGQLSAIANGPRGNTPAGVINTGISGNELTVDQTWPPEGVSALKRFERDVVDRAGVTDVVVLFGANDLNRGTDPAGWPNGASAGAIIAGYRMLADVAHQHHLRIYIGTVTPFAGYPYPGWYSPTKEATRQRVNRWIHTQGRRLFDGVVEFDQAVQGKYKPAPLAARHRPLPPGMANICAGDQGLHPNDRGYAVMGTLAYDAVFGADLEPRQLCH